MKIFIFCITLFAISLRCMCNKYIHLFSSCLLLQFHRELLISNSLNSNHSGFLSIPLIKPILFEDAILIALQILASLCTPQHSGPHTCAHTHTHVSGTGQLISPLNISSYVSQGRISCAPYLCTTLA